MKEKTIVRLGSMREEGSRVRIPAFFITRPAQSEQQNSKEELLVSLNLPLDQVNQESELFNRFVGMWEEYARNSGFEFYYDEGLYVKTGDTWQVIED